MGLKVLLRMGKLSQGDYYDNMGEFVMQKILSANSHCVDIGCHLGDVLEPMLRFAPHGRFFAFEPLPELFRHLQSRFGSDTRITLFNLALGDADGRVSFQYVLDAPAYSGFRLTDAGRSWKTVETIDVIEARLDDLLGGVDVDLVKIHVEGAEFQVLRGALELMKRCRPYVLFEHAEHAGAYNTAPGELFDLLNQECGLNISLLDSYLRGGRPLSRNEFTAVLKSEFYFLAHGR
jgi:FkbM family methyltransferase